MFSRHFCAVKRHMWGFVSTILTVLLLAGCGGGGGSSGGGVGSGAVASQNTFPINTAIANLVTNGYDAPFQISGNVGSYSVTGNGTYSWVPAVATYFGGQPALDAAIVGNMSATANGRNISVTGAIHQYFSPDNYYPLGQVDANDGTYSLVTSFSGWPTAAKIGDSGKLGAVTIYLDHTKTTITGYEQLSYTLEADTADTAILVLTTTDTDNNNASTSTSEDRYRITSAGGVTFVSSHGMDSPGTPDAGDLWFKATSVQSPGKATALPTPTFVSVLASGSFSFPTGLTVDSNGNVYVADSFNNAIRKITAGGVVSTFAGSGSFNFPAGVALDSAGNVYVADASNNMIRKITSGGVVSTLAGTGQQGSTNGPGNTATFFQPIGITVDSLGNIFVADSNNNMIRKITPDGVVSTLAGTGLQGSADGPGDTASFFHPYGIDMDGAGNIYVADYGNNMIRKITPDGVVSTLAGTGLQGSADGPGSTASFTSPVGVAVDSAGNVFVADTAAIRWINSNGVVTTLIGSQGSSNMSSSFSTLNSLHDIAMDSAGNLFVSAQNGSIYKIVIGY